MALSTSTSTANPELDSTSFKSKKVVGIDLEGSNQNCIWILDEDSIEPNRSICGTTEYWRFYKKHISPNQVNKIAYDLTRTGVASANEVRQFIANQTETKKSTKIRKKKGQNCIPIPVEDSSRIKIRWITLSNQKPPEQFNKKKSTVIVEVAVLIFLLLCLNGAWFWSLIFKLLTH